ncbi:hypothetical protein Glove_42g66 [Diversispora epigaea]|uniref:HAT C-terminal dimerisation domain-containing protein n=1 Tax=Diversispora epigaea TaxID=1348612 RepID=A0A397JPT9_9GLOM|nr:hypothetical protein Glove_42g66 [Diversispora epigaea]
MPATSVPSERLFSDAGNVLTDKRNRLSANIVHDLLFLKENSNIINVYPGKVSNSELLISDNNNLMNFINDSVAISADSSLLSILISFISSISSSEEIFKTSSS